MLLHGPHAKRSNDEPGPGLFPVVVDLAASGGAYLRDARQQKDLLDFCGVARTVPLGYNHPRLCEADLLALLGRLAAHRPCNCELVGSPIDELNETFDILVLGGHFSDNLFADGDWAAVENALKAAIVWKQRKNLLGKTKRRGTQILHFANGFHGNLGLSMSMLEPTEAGVTQFMPRLKWPRVGSPAVSYPLHEAALARVEQEEAQVLAQIDAAYEQNPGEIAAILIETIQSHGGDRFLRAQFLAALRRVCDERESLLVFDETRTGFGVTGQWWDHQHHQVLPDLLIYGGAAQVSGVAATERLLECGPVFDDLDNGYPHLTANLIDVVRCRRLIEIIRDSDLLGNATNMGAYQRKLLGELSQSQPEVTAVRGRGTWAAFDLPTPEDRDRVLWACFEEELLLAPTGSRSLRMFGALDVTADAIGRGIAQLEAGVRRAFGRRG